MLNNDIVGGDTTPGETTQEKNAVRVFSEGVPGPATIEQLHAIQTLGSESDSASREVARAIAGGGPDVLQARADAGSGGGGRAHANYIAVTEAFHPVMILRRDRFLRGGDHTSFNRKDFRRCGLRSGRRTSTISTRRTLGDGDGGVGWSMATS